LHLLNKTKTDSFQSQHTAQPALFRAINSLRGKHVVSRHFHCSYLIVNKVSKNEWIKKLDTYFETVLMLLTKNYQNYSMLVETTACRKLARF